MELGLEGYWFELRKTGGEQWSRLDKESWLYMAILPFSGFRQDSS